MRGERFNTVEKAKRVGLFTLAFITSQVLRGIEPVKAQEVCSDGNTSISGEINNWGVGERFGPGTEYQRVGSLQTGDNVNIVCSVVNQIGETWDGIRTPAGSIVFTRADFITTTDLGIIDSNTNTNADVNDANTIQNCANFRVIGETLNGVPISQVINGYESYGGLTVNQQVQLIKYIESVAQNALYPGTNWDNLPIFIDIGDQNMMNQLFSDGSGNMGMTGPVKLSDCDISPYNRIDQNTARLSFLLFMPYPDIMKVLSAHEFALLWGNKDGGSGRANAFYFGDAGQDWLGNYQNGGMSSFAVNAKCYEISDPMAQTDCLAIQQIFNS